MQAIEIHKKAWGEEHWMANRQFCGKLLFLRKKHRCSMHYHIAKDETFYVLSGSVFVEIDEAIWHLGPGDKQDILPGQRHRFTGLEDSVIVEFSTHHADEDSYRDTLSGEVPDDEFQKLVSLCGDAPLSSAGAREFTRPVAFRIPRD